MKLQAADITVLDHLLGTMHAGFRDEILKGFDCFIHPQVSLLIPSSGQSAHEGMQARCHPAYTFIYYFQPVCDLIVDGKNLSFDLADGKCLCAISPQTAYQEVPQNHFQSSITLMVEAALFNEVILQYTRQLPVFRGEAYFPHPELLGLLRCFMLELNDQNNRNSHLLDHLAQVIVHLTAHSITSEANQAAPLYDRFEVEGAIAYMNQHFSEKITLEDLAREVHRSPGHFSKIFKSVTAMTPIEFLQMLRLQKARMMLSCSSKPITDIAAECGFATPSYLSYCFMEKYQTTPSAYREKFQQTD